MTVAYSPIVTSYCAVCRRSTFHIMLASGVFFCKSCLAKGRRS